MKQIFTALILVLLVVLQSAGQTFCCLRTKKVDAAFVVVSAYPDFDSTTKDKMLNLWASNDAMFGMNVARTRGSCKS